MLMPGRGRAVTVCVASLAVPAVLWFGSVRQAVGSSCPNKDPAKGTCKDLSESKCEGRSLSGCTANRAIYPSYDDWATKFASNRQVLATGALTRCYDEFVCKWVPELIPSCQKDGTTPYYFEDRRLNVGSDC